MRRIRVSRTFLDQLNALLDYGFPRFGERVVLEKRELVFEAITRYLAYYPRRPRSPEHGLCVYSVSRTPFKLVYDFDDEELRVHFIFHNAANLEDLSSMTADW